MGTQQLKNLITIYQQGKYGKPTIPVTSELQPSAPNPIAVPPTGSTEFSSLNANTQKNSQHSGVDSRLKLNKKQKDTDLARSDQRKLKKLPYRKLTKSTDKVKGVKRERNGTKSMYSVTTANNSKPVRINNCSQFKEHFGF